MNLTTINERAVVVAAQEITAEGHSNPAELRRGQAKAMAMADPRPHAVCTVQTFRNAQTGAVQYVYTATRCHACLNRSCCAVGLMRSLKC
jgi:hypothetical protein